MEYHHADQIIRPYNNSAIWIGDLSSAQDLHWIRVNNIKTVITAAQGVNLKYNASIKHIHYKLQDVKTENISKVLEQAADKIQKSKISFLQNYLSNLGLKLGSVLVHCGAGVSRSSTLVIGYLLKYKKMDFLTALKYTKSKRPVICPNLGFQLQLKSFQKALKSRNQLKQSKNIQLPQISTEGQDNSSYNQKAKSQKDKDYSHLYRLDSSKFQKYLNPNITLINTTTNQNFNKKFNLKNISLNKLKVVNHSAKQSLNRENNVNQLLITQNIQFKNDFRNQHNHLILNKIHVKNSKNQKGLEYLKKMAMFRFGITNTQKWRLG